jgi:glutamine synthetase adenylyltransferase
VRSEQSRRVARPITFRLIIALVCYALALPFEALVVWSALQVIVADAVRGSDPAALTRVAAVALARAHPIPSAVFALASLAAAVIGARLHLAHRRAAQRHAATEAP